MSLVPNAPDTGPERPNSVDSGVGATPPPPTADAQSETRGDPPPADITRSYLDSLDTYMMLQHIRIYDLPTTWFPEGLWEALCHQFVATRALTYHMA